MRWATSAHELKAAYQHVGRAFLRRLKKAGNVSDISFERAHEQLHGLRSKILLVLQQVTPFGKCMSTRLARELMHFVATAARSEFDVRVVPQTHKTLNVL